MAVISHLFVGAYLRNIRNISKKQKLRNKGLREIEVFVRKFMYSTHQTIPTPSFRACLFLLKMNRSSLLKVKGELPKHSLYLEANKKKDFHKMQTATGFFVFRQTNLLNWVAPKTIILFQFSIIKIMPNFNNSAHVNDPESLR